MLNKGIELQDSGNPKEGNPYEERETVSHKTPSKSNLMAPEFQMMWNLRKDSGDDGSCCAPEENDKKFGSFQGYGDRDSMLKLTLMMFRKLGSCHGCFNQVKIQHG